MRANNSQVRTVDAHPFLSAAAVLVAVGSRKCERHDLAVRLAEIDRIAQNGYDLKSAQGRHIVGSLIDRANVFLQNLAPGAAELLGLGADEFRSTRSELIVVNMSGFGRGGTLDQCKSLRHADPVRSRPRLDYGHTPNAAVKTGIPTSDIAAGMSAAQSAHAALLRRCRTGEGATIDVAMLDTTVEWMGHALYTQMHTGAQSPRMGLSHNSIAPYRRVQHRTIAGPYDPHRHPLHPRRR